MTITDALTLAAELIESGQKHCDYDRTVELAETYEIYITGIGIEKKLIQFSPREEAALFAQRVRLTKSITPAVASSIRQPFNKVSGNDRVRKSITIASTNRRKAVDEMIKTFFGSSKKKNKGLDYWMKTRIPELEFIDPNTWIVLQWQKPDTGREVAKPKPAEVSAKEAVNFSVINDEIKWLFVKKCIDYKGCIKPETTNAAPAAGNPVDGIINGVIMPADYGKTNKKDGFKYVLYDEDVTVEFEQVDPEYLKLTGYVLADGEKFAVIRQNTFIIRVYEPRVGYPPVIRVGYKRDEHTKGRTFVNPWHDALCFFDKSLKTVSELDLTMDLHVFPQKIQYVQKCIGPSKEKRCNQGRLHDGSECGACKGTGIRIHTSAQDAILLPMPDSKDDFFDLEKLLVYKAPPVELVKFQNEYCMQLERQAHQAVFNSQVFVKKTTAAGSTNNGGNPAQTATESDYNMESVYDALRPYTEKFSEIWRDIVQTFGIIAGETIENIEVVHDFPADPKLKNTNLLLSERKQAADSGAPGFLLQSIDDDLATIIYTGDLLGMNKYHVMRRFYPFAGNTPDEIAELLTSQYVTEEDKILYSNFIKIFKEIEAENPEFWTGSTPKRQRELVEKKVAELKAILAGQKPAITLDTLREGNPLNGGGGSDNGGGGNPGGNDPAE